MRRTVFFVGETPDTVVVDVWQDLIDDHSADDSCTDVGRNYAYTVNLRQPLGRRKLLTHKLVKLAA